MVVVERVMGINNFDVAVKVAAGAACVVVVVVVICGDAVCGSCVVGVFAVVNKCCGVLPLKRGVGVDGGLVVVMDNSATLVGLELTFDNGCGLVVVINALGESPSGTENMGVLCGLLRLLLLLLLLFIIA